MTEDTGWKTVGNLQYNGSKCLGKGSFGVVFDGMNGTKKVAVKRIQIVHLDDSWKSRMKSEVELMQKADDHPNILQYICTEQDDTFVYIATECCAGTLTDYVNGKYKGPEIGDEKNILRQITEGLAYLHRIKIVHRDITPNNILIWIPFGDNTDDLVKPKLKLADFGLSKFKKMEDEQFITTSNPSGVEGWMAPELIQPMKDEYKTRSYDYSVDIFPLGCIFGCILSTDGKHPFGNSSIEQSTRIYNGDPIVLASSDLKTPYNVDEIAIQLIQSMTEMNPDKRIEADGILNHDFFAVSKSSSPSAGLACRPTRQLPKARRKIARKRPAKGPKRARKVDSLQALPKVRSTPNPALSSPLIKATDMIDDISHKTRAPSPEPKTLSNETVTVCVVVILTAVLPIICGITATIFFPSPTMNLDRNSASNKLSTAIQTFPPSNKWPGEESGIRPPSILTESEIRAAVENDAIIKTEEIIQLFFTERKLSAYELLRFTQLVSDRSVDVNDIFVSAGTNPLWFLFMRYNHTNLIFLARRLIENGIDVHISTTGEMSLLHIACLRYNHDNLIDLVELLLENGVDFNAKDKNGWNSLHFLGRYYVHDNLLELVELLLEKGADANAKNTNGETPLLILCQYYHHCNLIQLIELLLEKGADANAKDTYGWNSLHLLGQYNHNWDPIELVELFLEKGVDANSKTTGGWDLLHILCEQYNSKNLVDVVKLLERNGVDITAKAPDGWNILLTVCRFYCHSNLADLVKFLLQNGVDVNVETSNGWNALHFLCRYYIHDNLIDLVEILIEYGINVTAKTSNDGWNSLHYLSKYYLHRNLLSVVLFLEKQGIDLNEKTDEGVPASLLISGNPVAEKMSKVIQCLDGKGRISGMMLLTLYLASAIIVFVLLFLKYL